MPRNALAEHLGYDVQWLRSTEILQVRLRARYSDLMNRFYRVREQHSVIRAMGRATTRFLVQVPRNDTFAVSRHAE